MNGIFDLLEFANRPTLQNVCPSFFLLRNLWAKGDTQDTTVTINLKKEFVTSLDEKVWTSITSIHLAVTFLDPTLKGFAFVKNAKEKQALLKQAREAIQLCAAEVSGNADCEGDGPEDDNFSRRDNVRLT